MDWHDLNRIQVENIVELVWQVFLGHAKIGLGRLFDVVGLAWLLEGA